MSVPYLIVEATGAGASTSIVVTVTNATSAGDSISLAAGCGNTSVIGVTDSQDNEYTQATDTATGQKCSLWIASGETVALSTSDTITVTFTLTPTTYNIVASGFTGGDGGLDAPSVGTPGAGTSTSPSATSGSFAASGEVCYAVVQDGNGGGAPTLGSGWTYVGTPQHSGVGVWTGLAYQIVSGTSAVTFTATITSTTWTVLIAGLTNTATAGTVVQQVAGAPTATTFTVVSKTDGATSLRLKVATDSGLTENVTFVSAESPDDLHYTRHTVTGLSAQTQYYYQLADTPDGGDETLIGPVGMCKTLPAAGSPQNFNVSLVSCVTQAATDMSGINDWTAYNADLKIFTGDFDYSGTTSTDLNTQVGVYETQIASSGEGDSTATAAGYSSAYGMMTARAWGFYCRSDHEAGPDNGDSDNAYTATNIAAAQQVFPFGTLADTGDDPVHGLYQSWVVGRIRFIMIDIRNIDRSPGANTDDGSKTMLGATQLAWLKDQLVESEPLKVIISDVQWMGDPTEFLTTHGPDKWFSYTTERTDILDYIADNADAVKNVMLWHGDAHLIGCTPPSDNSWGGFPVYCAAPLHNVGGGLDTATFTEFYDADGANCRQYGRITFTDDGSTITSTFSGWDALNQVERVSQVDTFDAPLSGFSSAVIKVWNGTEWIATS